jgi:hypothetical protein
MDSIKNEIMLLNEKFIVEAEDNIAFGNNTSNIIMIMVL